MIGRKAAMAGDDGAGAEVGVLVGMQLHAEAE